jgi:hypothetical protein
LNLRQNNFLLPEILMLGYDAFIELFIEHQRFLVRLSNQLKLSATNSRNRVSPPMQKPLVAIWEEPQYLV